MNRKIRSSCIIVAFLLLGLLVPNAQAGDGCFRQRLKNRACKQACVPVTSCEQSCIARTTVTMTNPCQICVQGAPILPICRYPVEPTEQDCANARRNCIASGGSELFCEVCYQLCNISISKNLNGPSCCCNEAN